MRSLVIEQKGINVKATFSVAEREEVAFSVSSLLSFDAFYLPSALFTQHVELQTIT